MREIKLEPSSIWPDLKSGGGCDYFIVVDEKSVGSFCVESYGARIVDPSTGDEALVPNITVSVPRIDELMELLVRGGVRPEHLKDVVDDWL